MRSASAARPCARRSSSWPPTVTWRTCRASFYVKRVTEDSAREIVEIIGPLDGRAALLAVGDMTDDDIAQLQFLHGSMQLAIEKGLYKKYDDLQHDFHDCYVRKCGNSRLVG